MYVDNEALWKEVTLVGESNDLHRSRIRIRFNKGGSTVCAECQHHRLAFRLIRALTENSRAQRLVRVPGFEMAFVYNPSLHEEAL